MFALLAMMVISITYSVEKGLALSETVRFATYLILFFIIKYEFNRSKYIKGFINSYVVCVAIMSVFGIYQYFTGFGLNSNFVKTNGFLHRPQITVSLDNANNFGAFLILAIFPIIMLTLYERNNKKKILLGLLSISLLINIVFCYSRNAMAGFIIGFIVLAVIYSWRLLLPIGGVAALVFLIPQVGRRLMQISSSSKDYTRIKLWETAWYMIKQHPIFGVGNGNFVSLYDSYVAKYPELYIYYSYKRFPCHNSYLKIQSELGIFGSISFLGILLYSFLKIKRLIESTEDRLYRYFYTGFLASMVAFFFMNLSDNLFFVPKTTVCFWLLLAMGDAIMYGRKERMI
jgi:O-antigen ligase